MNQSSTPPPRRPGERAGLSAADVLEAARQVVLSEGADRLTMRRLAEHLGVAPNTLYSHYASKAELMDAVLDSLLGDIEVAGLDDMEWREGLVAVMEASRALLLRHPDLLPMMLSRPMRGPNVIRLGDQTLRLLARGGVEGPAAVAAMRALLMLTFGWVVIDAPRQDEPDPVSRQDRTREAYSGQRESRRMADLAEPLSQPPEAGAFETSLRWLIDGFVRDARGEPPAT